MCSKPNKLPKLLHPLGFAVLLSLFIVQIASAENFDELSLSKADENKEAYLLGYIDGTLNTIAKNSTEGVTLSAQIPSTSEIQAVILKMDFLYESHDLGNVYFLDLMPLAISKAKWPEYDLGSSIKGLNNQSYNKENHSETR